MKKIFVLFLCLLALSGCININLDVSTGEVSTGELSYYNGVKPWSKKGSIDFNMIETVENENLINHVILINSQAEFEDVSESYNFDLNYNKSDSYYAEKSLVLAGFKHAQNEKEIKVEYIGKTSMPEIYLSYETDKSTNSAPKNTVFVIEVDHDDVVRWDEISLSVFNRNNGSNESTYCNHQNAENGDLIPFSLIKYSPQYISDLSKTPLQIMRNWDDLNSLQQNEYSVNQFETQTLICLYIEFPFFNENLELLRVVKEQYKFTFVVLNKKREHLSAMMSGHYFEFFIDDIYANNLVMADIKYVDSKNSSWYDFRQLL